MEEQKKEVTLKEAWMKWIRKLLINKDGELSFMKLGAGLAVLAYAVTQLPESGIFVLPLIMTTAKIILGLGTYLGIVGARDAFGKK